MDASAADDRLDLQRYALERARLPITVGINVAGATVALGYLLGLVQGPLVAVIGGIALMTLGRGVSLASRDATALCWAFVTLALSWGVIAMRWSSLMLDDLRGVQAVLGPTALVGEREVVTGTALAGAGAIFALSVWAGRPRVQRARDIGIRMLETAPAALAIMTVLWGPALAGVPVVGVLTWVAGTVFVAAFAAVAGTLVFRSALSAVAVLGTATLSVAIGGVLIGRGL